MLGILGEQADKVCHQIYNTCSELEFIKLPKHKNLHEAVEAHADMLCFTLGNKLVVAPILYDPLVESFKNEGSKLEFHTSRGLEEVHVYRRNKQGYVSIIKGASALSAKYPSNIAYNVALVGKYALHNTKYTDTIVKKMLKEAGYECLHTKQGYTNCMCLVVNDKAVITSDAGIAKVLKQHGVDVLLIHQGHIDLPGMNYGFIGGASFRVRDCVYFVGNIMTHPQGQEMIDFISAHQVRYKCIGTSGLLDIGSLRFLKTL
ncbi:DUF6873 family GME fold protein [Fusibacter sp. JL216-2]|uniref:DUF6873 family GME fold protein n=1 Tax=Fusibacter sp. JL216-2 TaxID=3071453 RepID=UPI003D350E04